jgi:uncharacterized protein (TIGR02246 family)
MNLRDCSLLLVFASASAGCAPQCPAPSAPAALTRIATPAPAAAVADDAALTALIAQQADTWNRHDAAAWSAPFEPDAEFTNIMGMLLSGREQIEKRHAELFLGIFGHSSVVITTRKVTRLGADAALIDTVYELRGYERLPPGIFATDADGTLRTRMRYAVTLKGGDWHIAAAQNTAILPPPGGPSPR